MYQHTCPRCGRPIPKRYPIHGPCLIARAKFLLIIPMIVAVGTTGVDIALVSMANNGHMRPLSTPVALAVTASPKQPVTATSNPTFTAPLTLTETLSEPTISATPNTQSATNQADDTQTEASPSLVRSIGEINTRIPIATVTPEFGDLVGTLSPTVAATTTNVPLPTLSPTPTDQPTPTFTDTPTTLSAKLNVNYAINLRAGPSTSYPVVALINPTDAIELLSDQNGWGYVLVKKNYGWIDLRYVTYSGTLSDLAAPDTLNIQICSQPGSAFADAWAKVHWLIGCPTGAVKSMLGTSQPYTNGVMVWRSDTHQVYVILNDGHWSVYQDTWQNGDTLSCSGNYIKRGFGKVYCNNPDLQTLLGVPIGWERAGSTISIREFGQGVIFQIYAVGIRTLLKGNYANFVNLTPTSTP